MSSCCTDCHLHRVKVICLLTLCENDNDSDTEDPPGDVHVVWRDVKDTTR